MEYLYSSSSGNNMHEFEQDYNNNSAGASAGDFYPSSSSSAGAGSNLNNINVNAASLEQQLKALRRELKTKDDKITRLTEHAVMMGTHMDKLKMEVSE